MSSAPITRQDRQRRAARLVRQAENVERAAARVRFAPAAQLELLVRAHNLYRNAWRELELGTSEPSSPRRDPPGGPEGRSPSTGHMCAVEPAEQAQAHLIDIRALAAKLRWYNRHQDPGYVIWVRLTVGRFCRAYGQIRSRRAS